MIHYYFEICFVSLTVINEQRFILLLNVLVVKPCFMEFTALKQLQLITIIYVVSFFYGK